MQKSIRINRSANFLYAISICAASFSSRLLNMKRSPQREGHNKEREQRHD